MSVAPSQRIVPAATSQSKAAEPAAWAARRRRSSSSSSPSCDDLVSLLNARVQHNHHPRPGFSGLCAVKYGRRRLKKAETAWAFRGRHKACACSTGMQCAPDPLTLPCAAATKPRLAARARVEKASASSGLGSRPAGPGAAAEQNHAPRLQVELVCQDETRALRPILGRPAIAADFRRPVDGPGHARTARTAISGDRLWQRRAPRMAPVAGPQELTARARPDQGGRANSNTPLSARPAPARQDRRQQRRARQDGA